MEATLSQRARIKRAPDGGYRYMAPGVTLWGDSPERVEALIRQRNARRYRPKPEYAPFDFDAYLAG